MVRRATVTRGARRCSTSGHAVSSSVSSVVLLAVAAVLLGPRSTAAQRAVMVPGSGGSAPWFQTGDPFLGGGVGTSLNSFDPLSLKGVWFQNG